MKIVSQPIFINLYITIFYFAGKSLGILQSKVGVISVIRNFKVTLNEKTKMPINLEKIALMLNIEDRLWVNLEAVD